MMKLEKDEYENTYCPNCHKRLEPCEILSRKEEEITKQWMDSYDWPVLKVSLVDDEGCSVGETTFKVGEELHSWLKQTAGISYGEGYVVKIKDGRDTYQ